MEKKEPLELKLSPILKMIGVVILVGLIIVLMDAMVRSVPSFRNLVGDAPWILADLVHVPQFLIPFLLIYLLSGGKLSEYGFNRVEKPPTFTHRRMFGLGVGFGLLMSIRHVIRAFQGMPLDIPQPITVVNILGNLTFQWIVVGVSEETMFRGMIQTYLVKNLRGYLRILGHDLHIGTILGAIIWGAFHFINILVMPIDAVIFTVVVTTVAGLAMGYAFQVTGSLLTTIIVHNTIFGVPLVIGYILYFLF